MNIIHKVASNRPIRCASPRQLRPTSRCYQGVLGCLAAVKFNVEREFRETMAGYATLLKAALNEAEALAWQTPYPHLFFPTLAEEKAAEVRQWAARQRAIREGTTPGYPQLQLAA